MATQIGFCQLKTYFTDSKTIAYTQRIQYKHTTLGLFRTCQYLVPNS